MAKQPGSLLEKLKAFAAENETRKGPMCSACALPDPVRESLAAAREARYTFPQIAAVLAKDGHRVAAGTISRHLRGHA